MVTWQLSSGESLRIQLVRVLKTHQCLGCTRLILLIWEILSVCGHVGNEPWRGRNDTMSGISLGMKRSDYKFTDDL